MAVNPPVPLRAVTSLEADDDCWGGDSPRYAAGVSRRGRPRFSRCTAPVCRLGWDLLRRGMLVVSVLRARLEKQPTCQP